MLSLNAARVLRQAGLTWQPTEFDFFVVPDRGVDERVFVVSDTPAAVRKMQGTPMVTFEGAVEWALDYVPTGDVMWLPTEEQLRGLLAASHTSSWRSICQPAGAAAKYDLVGRPSASRPQMPARPTPRPCCTPFPPAL